MRLHFPCRLVRIMFSQGDRLQPIVAIEVERYLERVWLERIGSANDLATAICCWQFHKVKACRSIAQCAKEREDGGIR